MAQRIVLVHDYIKEYGGAERVLETLHEMYPSAPVYTLIYAPHFLGPHKKRFANWDIRPSFLQRIPFSYKFISIYRLIAPLVFRSFNFTNVDIIIVSATGAYSPNMINKQKAKQVCYYHTPPRYLYGYATARKASNNIMIKPLVSLMIKILRKVDYISSKKVDIFIANSKNTAARIKNFYQKDAIVIYPPVAIPAFNPTVSDRIYYLAGGRLARPKHIDLIVKSANELAITLKVFGKGFAGYGQELKQLGGVTVKFVGEVNDEEKLGLMRNARGFIFAAEDEDFGIVPVEAMGVGTPVIAYRSGGVLETIIEGQTGIFFDQLTVTSLVTTLKKFEREKFDGKACYLQANKFSPDIFIHSLKEIIDHI